MSMQDVVDKIESESPVTPEEVAGWDEVNKSESEVRETLENLVNGDGPMADMADLDESDVNF